MYTLLNMCMTMKIEKLGEYHFLQITTHHL